MFVWKPAAGIMSATMEFKTSLNGFLFEMQEHLSDRFFAAERGTRNPSEPAPILDFLNLEFSPAVMATQFFCALATDELFGPAMLLLSAAAVAVDHADDFNDFEESLRPFR